MFARLSGFYQVNRRTIKMDWSRETRKQETFLKLDHNQTGITSFFLIVDDIDRLIKENNELCKLLQNVQEEKQDIHTNVQLSSIFPVIGKCRKQLPQYKRYDEVLVRFAISLFIYAGPLAYNFIQSNMSTALPSLRTVQDLPVKENSGLMSY